MMTILVRCQGCTDWVKEENSINEEIINDDDDQPMNEPDVVQESRPTHKAMRKAIKQLLRRDTDDPWGVSRIARTNDVTLLCVLNRI